MKVKIEELIKKLSPLRELSFVVDVGAYEGEFTEKIASLYNCHIALFEPHPIKFNELCSKFYNKQNIECFPFGLGSENGATLLYLRAAGSSLFKEWANSDSCYEVQIRKLSGVMESRLWERIDLLKLNCEGAEYGIIDDLYENNFLQKVSEVVVQFHKIDGYKSKYEKAVEILSKTHEQTWKFKWEIWKRREVVEEEKTTLQSIGIGSGVSGGTTIKLAT